MRREVVVGFLVAIVAFGACRGRGGDGPESGEEGSGGEEEGAPSQPDEWSPDCPEAAFSMMTCVGSIEGARCPGTVHCECGERVTPCLCEAYDAGFHFVCEDDCAAACAGEPAVEEDGGTGGPPAGPTSCAEFCAPQIAASCPSPPTTCQADCESVEAMVPEGCRAAWEAVKACTAGAEMACDRSGVPQPVGCDEPTDAMWECLGA